MVDVRPAKEPENARPIPPYGTRKMYHEAQAANSDKSRSSDKPPVSISADGLFKPVADCRPDETICHLFQVIRGMDQVENVETSNC